MAAGGRQVMPIQTEQLSCSESESGSKPLVKYNAVAVSNVANSWQRNSALVSRRASIVACTMLSVTLAACDRTDGDRDNDDFANIVRPTTFIEPNPSPGVTGAFQSPNSGIGGSDLDTDGTGGVPDAGGDGNGGVPDAGGDGNGGVPDADGDGNGGVPDADCRWRCNRWCGRICSDHCCRPTDIVSDDW